MSGDNGARGYYAVLLVGMLVGGWLVRRYDELGQIGSLPMLIGLVLGIFYYAWWFWKNQPKA